MSEYSGKTPIGVVSSDGHVLFPAVYEEILYKWTKNVFVAFADGKTFLYGKGSNEILACLDGNNKVSFKEDRVIFHRMGSPNYDTLTPAAF